jgi:hypothetical protein
MTGKSDQPKDKDSQAGGRMTKRSSIPHDEDANARPVVNKGMFSLDEGVCNMMVLIYELNGYGYNCVIVTFPNQTIAKRMSEIVMCCNCYVLWQNNKSINYQTLRTGTYTVQCVLYLCIIGEYRRRHKSVSSHSTVLYVVPIHEST